MPAGAGAAHTYVPYLPLTAAPIRDVWAAVGGRVFRVRAHAALRQRLRKVRWCMEGAPSMRGWMMEGRAHEVRRRPSLAPPTAGAGAGAVSSAPALAAHRGVQARKQPPLVCAGAGSDCWWPRPGRTTSTTGHSLRAAAGGAAGGLGASPSSATNEVGTRCRSRCCPGGRLPPSGHLMDGLPLPPGLPTS